ncbi:MAG: endonuclease MutS2 [Almyronema sp.]
MIQSETLDLLEWPRLCQQLATFAATKLGAIAARHLTLPKRQAESESLLTQTQQVDWLESETTGLSFSGIEDIGAALDRVEKQGVLSGKELLAIATTLNGARQLRRTIDSYETEVPALSELVVDLRTSPELEQAIHHAIDDLGEVSDRASPKLGGIRSQLKQGRDQIYQKLQRILQRQAGAVQEQLITQRSDRFVIPVKAPQKDAIPGIVHDASTSGATLYIEPQSVIEMGNRLRQLQRQEKTEEDRILRQLSAQVAEALPDLEHLLAIVTTLDLATARARYSRWLEANPPRFVTADDVTTLRQLRHPLLVWQAQHEDGPAVIPTNVVIQPQIRVVAITGPNTGGKTVTLKTLGLAALMAKAGLFIPAREPVEMPWFDQVLADIGDEQSIEQSLSTFSGHIRRISRILTALQPVAMADSPVIEAPSPSAPVEPTPPDPTAVDKPVWPLAPSLTNALVLLDEVGAGTDPSEGSALAIALLRHLADHARLTVATTHFGELKALKYEDERFENASVEFDEVTLSPTYRLLWGIPGRSNALSIARRLGLDEAVVAEAENYVGLGGQEDVNQVIAGLEAQRRRQENSAEETAKLLAQAEKLHAEVANKAQQLQTREQELKRQQEQAVQSAIAEAKAEIAKVIRRLQQGEPKAQAAQQATAAIDQIAHQQLPPPSPPRQPGFRPKTGDRVRIPSLGQTADVLTEPDEDNKLTVRFGLMKMTVALSDIESLAGEKADIPVKPAAPLPTVPAAKAPAVRTARNTFDLRGQRVSEAEVTLEAAIAKANGPIWIIHGHGTGKLKQGVHEFLKRHPQVERWEPAAQADGGTGVTVAYV